MMQIMVLRAVLETQCLLQGCLLFVSEIRIARGLGEKKSLNKIVSGGYCWIGYSISRGLRSSLTPIVSGAFCRS